MRLPCARCVPGQQWPLQGFRLRQTNAQARQQCRLELVAYREGLFSRLLGRAGKERCSRVTRWQARQVEKHLTQCVTHILCSLETGPPAPFRGQASEAEANKAPATQSESHQVHSQL